MTPLQVKATPVRLVKGVARCIYCNKLPSLNLLIYVNVQ